MTALEYILMHIGFGLWFWTGYSTAKYHFNKKQLEEKLKND